MEGNQTSVIESSDGDIKKKKRSQFNIELEPIDGSQFTVKETFPAYQILQLGAINRLQLNVKLPRVNFRANRP